MASAVRDIFSAKCTECHGDDLPRPKGRFGYVLDLERLAGNVHLVVPFRPDESELWKLVRDEQMPPAHAKAGVYELRYAPLGTDGAPSTWGSATLTAARNAAPVNRLTPGTTYAFQVRALGKLGYTDWSDSATRMCT